MAHDARMTDFISANPSFEQHMRDWQTERHQKGENPFDWAAFRTLEAYVGATDPGDVPPTEFYWFTPPAGERPRTMATSDSPVGAPSATLVSPASLRASAPGGSSELTSGGSDRLYNP